MAVTITAAGRPDVRPLRLGDRFRQEVVYFADEPAATAPGVRPVDPDQARRLLDDGVFRLVSPLDSDATAEIELSEDHEAFLEWVVAHAVTGVTLN